MAGRQVNTKLKGAILEAGLTQRELAKKARIPEFYISMAIHGKFIFDTLQMAKIASTLGKTEDDLFQIQ